MGEKHLFLSMMLQHAHAQNVEKYVSGAHNLVQMGSQGYSTFPGIDATMHYVIQLYIYVIEFVVGNATISSINTENSW